MRSPISVLAAGSATALIVLASVALAGELTVKAIPKPILEAVKARFKDAKVVGGAKEKTPEGALVYEVSLQEKGRTIDVTLSDQAAITLIEKGMPFKELPKPVADTLTWYYPKAKYKAVEQVFTVEEQKETFAYYEALFTDSKKQAWTVELGADGTILKTEKKISVDE